MCENPRFQPPALLKIEQLTFTSSGLPRIDAKCGDHCLQADFQGNFDKMQITAGSFALVGMSALQDSTVAAKLRAGGTVILGKTNLSEWANFRSFESITFAF